MPVLLKTVMENHLDTAMVSIVTDDLHTVDLQERGHLDDSLRTALGMGLTLSRLFRWLPSTAHGRSIWIGRSADWHPDAGRTSISPPVRRISAC